jgi:hypothetical protein
MTRSIRFVGCVCSVLFMAGCVDPSDDQMDATSSDGAAEALREARPTKPADLVRTPEGAPANLPFPEPVELYSDELTANSCSGFACCNAGTVGMVQICGNYPNGYCVFQLQGGSCDMNNMWSCWNVWVMSGCNR